MPSLAGGEAIREGEEVGVFGRIYRQFKGKAKEAIDFLRQKRSGEAVGALYHPNIGDISLVWGDEKQGLQKIAEKHPEVLDDLQGIIAGMSIVQQSDNRIVLESSTHKAVVSKMKGDKPVPNWLLTAYEKKKPVSASSSDIETEPKGKQNGTATLQNELSEVKGSENILDEQIGGSAISRIPVDSGGNPMYESVDSDTAWNAIIEQTEGDEAMARSVVDSMVSDKEAALKKLQRSKSKGGATIAEKIASEKERQAAIAGAEAELEKWRAIAGVSQRRAEEAEAERRRIAEEAEALRKAEEERLRAEREEAERIERIKEATRGFKRNYEKMGEVSSLYELILRLISSGDLKFKWGDNSTGTKGLGHHLGFNSESERRKRIWMLNNATGYSPEQAAEWIEERFRDTGLLTGYDTKDVLDEILDVIRSNSTAKDMYDKVVDIQIGVQERYDELSAHSFEIWLMENLGISLEEYEAYEESVRAEIEKKHLSEKEYDEYNNLIAEETLEREENESRDEENQRDEQVGIDEIRTRSDGILPSESFVSGGGNSPIESGGRVEVDDHRDSEDGAVSESSSTGGGRSENKRHLAERQGDLGTSVETSDKEFDEDGLPFVISSTGTTVFGEIKEETGLTPAPIKLSLGNSKYGLVHLEKRHGKQIRNAGFNSVEEFVEYVCKNYKRIRQGENNVGEENGTYLLQIEDNHNNTLYVELSTDGSYWGVNSGGVFRKEYGNNKKEVWSASEAQNEQSATDSTLRDEDKSDNPTTPNGNVPSTSDSKDTTNPPTTNELDEKNAVPAQQLATEAVLTALRNGGIEVIEASDAMVEEVLGEQNAEFSKKKRAFETASVQKEHQPTVVSNADGAKVLKNLDTTAREYEEKSNQSKTFLGDLANALGANKNGSDSQYATFETVNGKIVTIRLSNHNATVSNFDNNNETDGISIVVSAKENQGIINDGEAHVVEYYYDAINLRKADGKPLAEIVKSIKQALYSGEFVDTTGLAERQEVNLNAPQFSIGLSPKGVFYSNARKAVVDIKQDKATPQQWIAMLKKSGGLKAGEDAWLGLEEWLNQQNGSVSKQEILEYIDSNTIEIEEVSYSDEANEVLREMALALRSEYEDLISGGMTAEEAWASMEERYGDVINEAIEGSTFAIKDVEYALDLYYYIYGEDLVKDDHAINSTRLDYTTEGLKNKREIALTVPTVEAYNITDEIHFGDAGEGTAVAWIRFGETTDTEGNRVLVIDEIQSKRHQDGREKGYRSKDYQEQATKAREEYSEAVKAFDAYRKQMFDKYGNPMAVRGTSEERRKARRDWKKQFTIEELTTYDILHDRQTDARLKYEKLSDSRTAVPVAPFEKNWQELAMKRMLRYAAENGFAKVAWTTGEQQAKRYDIGNSVSAINRDDTGILIETTSGDISIDFDNEGKISTGQFSGGTLSDVFGKDIADKILNMNSGETLSTSDLHIGGEGMKGFYDKMLPSFMNKYGKKWGVKVGEVMMPGLAEGYQTMHSVEVTPQMRDDVMQGQPMFFRTPRGVVYGWTIGGKIYLTPHGMNPNTPIHEYTHLWANAMMQRNPKGWESVKTLLRGTPKWKEVMTDSNYSEIQGNEDLVASEVLSRLSGKENAAKLEAESERMIVEADGALAKSEAVSLIERMKRALQEFWNWVGTNLFEIAGFDSIEQVTNRVLWDLLNGTDLQSGVRTTEIAEKMFVGEKGATALDKAQEATTRLDNLSIAREMENHFAEKKLRIEKLKASKPIEIQFNGEFDLNRDSAKQWLKNNIRGEYINNDTGEVIQVSKVGINEVTSHGERDEAHLKSLVGVPSIIENAVFIEEHPNIKGHDKYDSYRYYVCGLKINGIDYTAKVVIGVKGDNKYYDHRLTQIEKGTLIDNLNGLSNSVAENQNTPHLGKDKRLISIIQINEQENARRIKFATGWERGGDGKWRYETNDYNNFDRKGELHKERYQLSSKLQKEYEDLELEGITAWAIGIDKIDLNKEPQITEIYIAGGMTPERAKRLVELQNIEKELKNEIRRLDDYIDAPDLFTAYPELRNVGVEISNDFNQTVLGAYNPIDNIITLYNGGFVSTLLHEIQHVIQEIEGFAKGGNTSNVVTLKDQFKADVAKLKELMNNTPEWREYNQALDRYFEDDTDTESADLAQSIYESGKLTEILDEQNRLRQKYGMNPIVGQIINEPPATDSEIWKKLPKSFSDKYESYHRLGGEVEARNVQSRISLTEDERRAKLAEETEDVAREDQIFITENASRFDKARSKQEELQSDVNKSDDEVLYRSEEEEKSPEIWLPEDESSFKGTAISSDDGTKILKNIDNVIYKYENSNRIETFVGDVANALGVDKKNKSSKYATFETMNGKIVTIRISDHNATVSNFDNNGEENGISIVVSRKPNEGVTNDGNAHVVEFFYSDKKLKTADGKPLAEILKSIKQALYSGEYRDTTGLAEREEVNDDLLYRIYGGNSGYVGYSKSKRAVETEERGLRNKSQMNSEFAEAVNRYILEQTGRASRLTLKEIKAALSEIRADEWHHTSKYGNRTNYYSVENVAKYFAPEIKDDVNSPTEVEQLESELRRLWDEMSNHVRGAIPTETIPTEFGEREAFKTSEGYYLEVIPNQLIDSKPRMYAYGPTSENGDLWVDEWWEFKNRAAYERAVSEFKEARQKGVETIPAELRERYERTMTERDSAFERQIEASRGREGDGAVSVSTSDRAMMRAKAEELSERLGIEIEILEDGSEFTGKKSKAKGFFNPKTGKVTIILGNNKDLADVEQTVLHEAVAHYGLRQLFGEHFDTFLDNIYEHSEPSIRRAIDELAKRRGYSLRTATEEYLAQLAEDSSIYESERHSWLHKVRAFFRDMLEALGFEYAGDSISFNEIRYILWRSYENLTERGGGLLGRAKDVAIQHRLGIGEYAYRGEENAIEQINGRFNAELERQVAGKLPQGHIYELGMPGEALLRAGLPNLPIEMSSTRLAEKSRQDNHPFAMSEVRDLPRAIQEPMAVFRSATHIGSYVVLTEIEHNGKNYVVAIETNRRDGKIEVNSVRSVHYRTSNIHFVNWIEDGLLEYADKEKMSEWISKQRYHSADVRNRFRHVAKIVEKFENPAIEEDVFYREGEENERRSIFDRARGIASRLFGRGQQATEAEQTATEEPSYFDPDEYIERNGNDSRTPEEELAELGYEVDAEAMQREISSGNDLGSVYPEQETPASIAKHLVTLIKYRRGDISLQEAESELFGGSIGQSEAELRELMEWHYAQKAAVLRGVTPAESKTASEGVLSTESSGTEAVSEELSPLTGDEMIPEGEETGPSVSASDESNETETTPRAKRKERGKEVVRPDELTGIRERYDRRIRSGMYQSIEAMQDNIHNYAEYA